MRALGQHLPSSPDALPPGAQKRVGAKQINPQGISLPPHPQPCAVSRDRHFGFLPEEGPAGAILQPHLQVSLPNEASDCTGTPLGLLFLPQTLSCGSVCSCVSEKQHELKLLGIPFRHSIQMASGCSAQAPPFTHPGTQPTQVGTPPRHRRSPLTFGPFAMKHFV